jgi:hypothetical protein
VPDLPSLALALNIGIAYDEQLEPRISTTVATQWFPYTVSPPIPALAFTVPSLHR